MTEIKQVVLATDFSEASDKVTEMAQAFCRQMDAELMVIHVMSDGTFGVPAPTEAEIDKEMEDSKEKLTRICNECGPKGHCEPLVLKGNPVQRIARYVSDHQVDMLLLGKHSYSKWDRLLNASVSEQIKHEVHCPVLQA